MSTTERQNKLISAKRWKNNNKYLFDFKRFRVQKSLIRKLLFNTGNRIQRKILKSQKIAIGKRTRCRDMKQSTGRCY